MYSLLGVKTPNRMEPPLTLRKPKIWRLRVWKMGKRAKQQNSKIPRNAFRLCCYHNYPFWLRPKTSEWSNLISWMDGRSVLLFIFTTSRQAHSTRQHTHTHTHAQRHGLEVSPSNPSSFLAIYHPLFWLWLWLCLSYTYHFFFLLCFSFIFEIKMEQNICINI